MPDREESESQPPVSQEVKEEGVAQAPSKPDSDEDYF